MTKQHTKKNSRIKQFSRICKHTYANYSRHHRRHRYHNHHRHGHGVVINAISIIVHRQTLRICRHHHHHLYVPAECAAQLVTGLRSRQICHNECYARPVTQRVSACARMDHKTSVGVCGGERTDEAVFRWPQTECHRLKHYTRFARLPTEQQQTKTPNKNHNKKKNIREFGNVWCTTFSRARSE